MMRRKNNHNEEKISSNTKEKKIKKKSNKRCAIFAGVVLVHQSNALYSKCTKSVTIIKTRAIDGFWNNLNFNISVIDCVMMLF